MNERIPKKMRQIHRRAIVSAYWKQKPSFYPRSLWRWHIERMFPNLKNSFKK